MVGSDEKPRPPAAAYGVMASLLKDEYFMMAPPEAGTCMTVTGTDGVETYWEMNKATADVVERQLRARPDVSYRRNKYTRATGPGRI